MADEPSSPVLRLAFIGGGSGGHLFPALSVGEASRKLGETTFLFLISQRPVDAQILATAAWSADQMQQLAYAKMPSRSGFLSQLMMIPEWCRAYRAAKSALRAFRPDVCVGLGASASVPGMIAADHLKIPLVLMEQNTIPGKATKLLASRAQVTLAGLPFKSQLARDWPGELIVTGTPVREQISQLALRSKCDSHRGRLLILGGSQGSASVNRIVLEALEDEHCIPSDWEIIHQTGESQVVQVSEEYSKRGRTATVLSFIPNLPHILSSTTFVVSRAGAGTLQELACSQLPCILIPFSAAAAGHQLENARYLATLGAAVLVAETDEDAGAQLRQLLNKFVQDSSLRARFSQGIAKLARPDAAEKSALLLRSITRLS